MERYERREIRILELWEPGGWRIKVYGIGAEGRMPPAALVDAGKEAASTVLDRVASATDHHGVGFLAVHEGRGADVVFLDWWAAENELHHHLWIAEPGRPASLRLRAPADFVACVWDLEVIGFERDAWVRHVMEHPDDPLWEEYVAATLDRRGT